MDLYTQINNNLKISAIISSLAFMAGFYFLKTQTNTDEVEQEELLKRPKQYVGLPNLGNTCYLNSLLQALSGCKQYVRYAEKLVDMQLIAENAKVGSETTIQILNNFIMLLLQLSLHDQDANPEMLYHLICQDGEFTRMNEECDAHELNLFMQDKLISLVPKNLRQRLRQSESTQEVLRLTDSVFSEGEVAHQSLNPIDRQTQMNAQNPLVAMYETTIECQVCKQENNGTDHLIHRHEFQLDINLDIPATPDKVKLSNLLLQYFNAEQVDGYNCIKCSLRKYLMRFTDNLENPEWKIDQKISEKEKSDLINALEFFSKIYRTQDIDQEEFVKQFKAFKTLTNNTSTHNIPIAKVKITKAKQLLRPPKTLVIHFNRLAYDNQGQMFINRNQVEFPEILKLSSEFLCPYDIDLSYRLAAVIEHIGTPRFGHYIAAKRILRPIDGDKNQFLLCNDSKVSPILLEQVLQSKAYMLFYEKINN